MPAHRSSDLACRCNALRWSALLRWTGSYKGTTVRPVLILNPRHDRAFVALAERLVDGGATTSDALQAALRERYPAAVVRPRVLSSEPEVLWYVYREGRWITSLAEES